MKLTSLQFENMKYIPKKYTCEGDNVNPSLIISNVPKKTKSLVLIVDDPDAPKGVWDHWLMWNILPDTKKIEENSIPKNAVQGLNSSGTKKYIGPCPPSSTHRYFFKLYAIDKILEISSNFRKKEVIELIENNILDHSELVGLYFRK